MFDIHMHIIPGVDDGSRDMEMSGAMLEQAWSEGIRAIIATPHSHAFRQPEKVMERFVALKKRLSGRGSQMTLALGCEVLFAGDNTDDTMERLKSGQLPSLNGTQYVLTEFMPDVDVAYALNVLQRLRAAEYIPVIAHAERYPKVFGNAKRAAEIHKLALIQINAYSLTEERDEGIRDIARMLLNHGLVDFIGTDAHRMDHRAPNAASGIRYVRENCDPAYARAVLWGNAKRLLRLGEHPYLDGLMGLAVGDALGVPYERFTLEEMRREPCVGMRGGGAHRQPAGTWSDDTSMALCIADSLGTKGVDPDDVMKKFSAWNNRCQYTATGAVFDVGTTCRRGIRNFDLGAPPELCGDYTENGNGNGGLMRTFPVALYACLQMDNLDDMLGLVHSYSALTHGHPVGLICCGLYALFIREWLSRGQGETALDVMERAIEKGRAHYAAMGGGFEEAINRTGLFFSAKALKAKTEEQLSTFGYVINTWNIAVWSLLNTDNYRDCVLKAVNLGGDADTNAAVAGSLAGFIYGCEDIPEEWLETLQNRQLIERFAYRLDDGGRDSAEACIDKFIGEYAFLSMKAKCPIEIDGIEYQNLTSAWLAQAVPEENRYEFVGLNAHQARRLFNQLPHREDWSERRTEALRCACEAKFRQNPALVSKLLATANRPIIYDTTGSHDNELGRCACPGCQNQEAENLYGKILMDVRYKLKEMIPE